MNTTTITVGSVTYAIKVRKILERAGIRSDLIKINASASERGCAYGIKINSAYFYDAVSIMKNNGIQYSVLPNNDIS